MVDMVVRLERTTTGLTFIFAFVNICLMLKIRLQRVGRKNDASFRVVVIESQRGPKAGNVLEVLGFYDPKKDVIEIKGERALYWISVGAQASPTVHNLLVKGKIIKGKTINVLPKKSPIKKDTPSDSDEKSKESESEEVKEKEEKEKEPKEKENKNEDKTSKEQEDGNKSEEKSPVPTQTGSPKEAEEEIKEKEEKRS